VRYYQHRNSSAGILVSGSVKFMRIFARVLQKAASNDSGVARYRSSRTLVFFLTFENNCIQVNQLSYTV